MIEGLFIGIGIGISITLIVVLWVNKINKENLTLKGKLLDVEMQSVNKSIDDKPLSDLVRDANESDGDHT